MNSTPDDQDDNLDRLLDETLDSLKEREAPASMLPNIMARVAEVEQVQQLTWFARLRWPVVAVSACSVLLFTFYSNSLFQYLFNSIKAGTYAKEIQDINTGLQVIATLGNAFSKVVALVPYPILVSAVASAFLLTAVSCAGFGTVLFRLTRSSDSMTTNNAI